MDGRGVPLSIVVTGANRHDVTQLAAVLDGRVVRYRGRARMHLCADAGYTGARALRIMAERGYIPHVRSRGRNGRRRSAEGRPADGWSRRRTRG